MKRLNVLLICILLASLMGCASHPPKAEAPAATNLERFGIYVKQGNERMSKHQYKEAITAFKEALKFNPESAVAYNLIGICYFQLRLYDSAGDQFRQALKLNASFAKAHNNLGTVYYAKLKYKKAIKEFNQALKLDPKIASAYHNLANIYLAQKQIDKAIKFYKEAFKLNPEYLAPSHTNIASVTRFPEGKGEAEYSFACVLASSGEREKALEYLKKAIDKGFSDWDRIKNEPDFQLLRDDPNFKKLIKKF